MGDLQRMFTAAVVAVETRAAELDESRLWPEEDAALGEVVAGRRWDWVMGRRCAREAMETLGVTPAPILAGDSREPLWPSGVVGAITHTTGYAAAAVARQGEVLSMGIDAEPDEPLPDGVLRRVSIPSERAWIESGDDLGVACPDRLVFCVKEAIYKAWYPLAGSWLGFEDAQVVIEPESGTFAADIGIAGPFSSVSGRYAAVDGLILATVELA